jgi:hypothetical protein
MSWSSAVLLADASRERNRWERRLALGESCASRSALGLAGPWRAGGTRCRQCLGSGVCRECEMCTRGGVEEQALRFGESLRSGFPRTPGAVRGSCSCSPTGCRTSSFPRHAARGARRGRRVRATPIPRKRSRSLTRRGGPAHSTAGRSQESDGSDKTRALIQDPDQRARRPVRARCWHLREMSPGYSRRTSQLRIREPGGLTNSCAIAASASVASCANAHRSRSPRRTTSRSRCRSKRRS